jgi:hypothetical protein
MEILQSENLLHIKGTVTRVKTQLTEWKKIFASYSLDKGLISTMYKGLQKINTKISN